MAQLTVRKVDESLVQQAKAEAAERGVSMNTILVEALNEKFGVSDKPKTNGLEKFAGTVPEGFGPEFDAAMKECSRINPEDWQ